MIKNKFQKVKAWYEEVVIPTYLVGKPDKNPHFLEKRVYQGSSGIVYPHYMIDKILDKKENKKYNAIYIENEFIKVMILPELGGKIHEAYDKKNQRDFVYKNDVIKPVLVGLAGPWISGGIEFNWPQHHRPSTFDPIDSTIINNQNGSVTAIVGETEKMYRTKVALSFTLYPDKAFIEILGKIFNGTNLPQNFLWWANPAVKASGGHQSIFPPDVNAVYDHGKRDVSKFPIAHGTYYKMDYSQGVDISRYDNIPVPTSYMANKSKYDFVGAYVHEEEGGLLHVANHHISPGKKQWTWGNSDFGIAWNKNLTDTSGPYIELMTGVYCDNQPDFSWLSPYEEKEFVQYFMPYIKLGNIKNANKDIAIKCDLENNNIKLGIYTSGFESDIKVELKYKDKILFSTNNISTSPSCAWLHSISTNLKSEKNISFLVFIQNKKVIKWKYESKEYEIPNAAIPPKKPKDIKSSDELIFVGEFIEQYKYATAKAEDYYLEVIKRDKLDSRANLALARLFFRRGAFWDAFKFINNSLKRILNRSENPYDGEALFLRGLILESLNKDDEAYDSFYKSSWNSSYVASSFFALSRLAFKKQNYEKALEFVEKSLNKNATNHKAQHLQLIILRVLQHTQLAKELANKYIKQSPLDIAILFEIFQIIKDKDALLKFIKISRLSETTLVDIASDYLQINDFVSIIKMLEMIQKVKDPMIYLYISYAYKNIGKIKKAISFCKKAELLINSPIFPNKIDDIQVLESAIQMTSSNIAQYLLGCLYYDKKQYDQAITLWEDAVQNKTQISTVYRNLAISYYNKKGLPNESLKMMNKAIALDVQDTRKLFELNDLLLKMHKSPKDRAYIFKDYGKMTSRDDLYIEYVRFLNLQGKYKDAQSKIDNYNFHPWEGGEGKITSQYSINKIGIAIKQMKKSMFEEALVTLHLALQYPPNLGEGKLPFTSDNDIHFLLGILYKKTKNNKKSLEHFKFATKGLNEIKNPLYYNDMPVDFVFYKALAYKELDENNKSANIFDELINFGKNKFHDNLEIDFFAISSPNVVAFEEDLQYKNKVHCHFVQALGYYGKGDMINYHLHVNEVLKLEPNHDKANITKKVLSVLNT